MMSAEQARPFLFVLHCHQPPGNLPAVLDEAYARCYLPLLETLERHPEVKVCLHVSGALLEHAVAHRPAFVSALASAVAREQVELLGGGCYEPVLSVLPDPDAEGQLEMMSLLLAKHFGARPRGAWLTERAWDPDLPRLLVPAGLRYTFVDAINVQASLPDDGVADGYWITQKAGQTLAVFAVDRGLRYRIPSDDPEALVAALPGRPGQDLVTFADDGEKLGLWPGSHEWVFEQGWLDRFFAALTVGQAEGRVQTVLPSQYLEVAPPRGRLHLASGAYEELSRWALGADASVRLRRLEAAVGPDEVDRAFLRGGTWPDFLVRYPEAGRLYGRMISVSERLQDALEAATARHPGGRLPGDLQDRLGTAQRALYRAQGADPYWRGLFGGLHSAFLRADAHRALLFADRVLDEIAQGDEEWVAYEERDLDLDGELEVSLYNRTLGVHVRPQEGGALLGLEDKTREVSLLDVLARRAEPEHGDAPADTLDPLDDGPRWGFLDRFLPADASEEARDAAAAHDLGDLSRARAKVTALRVDEGEQIAAELGLTMKGQVAGRPLTVTKTYRLDLEGAHLGLSYDFVSESDEPSDVLFCPELSLALGEGARLRIDGEPEWRELSGDYDARGEVVLEDAQTGLRMTFDLSQPTRLLARPVMTTVRTAQGFERLWQGWGLVFGFEITLGAPESARVQIGVDVAGTAT